MSLFPTTSAPRVLRQYQEDGIERLRQSLISGRKRPLLQAATGAGKTAIAGAVIRMALQKGKRVAFCVPALSLIDQTVESFYRDGIHDIGVIQANHVLTDYSKPVQVCSVDTLARRGFPKVDFALIDEAHRRSKAIEQWMAQEPDKIFVGLSASPWSKGLGKHYDDLIVVATTGQLIDQGWLSPFRVFAPSHPDLSSVRTVAGEYHEGDLSKAMDKPTLVADIVDTWIKRGEERPTLCFAVDCAHAKSIQQRFEAAGVRCGYQDAYTDPIQRAQIRRDFHTGDLQVVSNVGTLTTGVDWDVRCIILAKPTKSEMLFVQIVGRGLRTADGKLDCLERDTLILTDQGEVKIQDVTLDHKVWDGVNFVSHRGAICKGKQTVITYDGVTGTPDHKVMTNGGWQTLAHAARNGSRISRTGIGRFPLRFFDDYLGQDRGRDLQSAGRSLVRSVWHFAHGAVSQYSQEAGYESVPLLQWASACDGAALALSALSGAAITLLQSFRSVVQALWRPWDRIWFRIAERSRQVECRASGNSGSIHGDRSDRQRRTLCAWESSLGECCGQYEQYESVGPSRAVHRFPIGASGGSVRGQDACSVGGDPDGRRDRGSLAHAFMQAEGEVWDIVNAGPLQRFTANGRLVHNCLILDHSDNHARLGFVTDIHHDKLDDGKRNEQVRKPKVLLPQECPKCSYLRAPKVRVCPSCGFKPEPVSSVDVGDGELREVVRGKGTKLSGPSGTITLRGTTIPLGEFYGMLKRYAAEHGYKPGWAANKFKEAAETWPNAYRDAPERDVTFEVLSWLKASQIRWAKRRAKESESPTVPA